MKIYLTTYLTFMLLILCVSGQETKYVNVWGPGLQPNEIIMPVRYFFIELKNYNDNATNDLNVFVQGNNNYPCRIRTNLLDRRDGTYIFRYKLYETCNKLQIDVLYKNLHIGRSPYVFDTVYADECDCPQEMSLWLEKWQCNKVSDRVAKDLAEFDNIDWNNLREQVIAKFHSPGSVSLCHYVIKSNSIYRTCYGKYTGFKMFMDSMLLSLSRKVVIPDIEFFVNLGDWPLTSIAAKYPIFSWCSSTDSFDIVMPTYDIAQSTLENLGRVTLDMLSVQGNVNRIWKDRIPQAFWRGRDSNKERLKLVDIARENPNLFNVSLTNFFFFHDKVEQYGPKSDHISFFSFFDYKYQISIDGTVAAYRLPYLFGGGSLVFKQNSKYYEHFYGDLIPYVHYIPIKRDLSDLVEKITWATLNDDDAYKIAKKGQKYANDNLLPKDIFCYYGHLINEFSKIVTSTINILDGMELVTSSDSLKCDCHDPIKDEL